MKRKVPAEDVINAWAGLSWLKIKERLSFLWYFLWGKGRSWGPIFWEIDAAMIPTISVRGRNCCSVNVLFSCRKEKKEITIGPACCLFAGRPAQVDKIPGSCMIQTCMCCATCQKIGRSSTCNLDD